MNMLMSCMLGFLALVNPISKILFVSTMAEAADKTTVRQICLKASLVAVGILMTFALMGHVLLTMIFQVHIYSFQIVGGLMLVWRGFQALNKGIFFELDLKQKLEDASIVPLASPMIAGPATITAAVSFPAKFGMPITLISIILAVLINWWIMLYSTAISRALKEHNLMGALIRITGLIVATIGMQMMLDGIGMYMRTV